jgi:glycerate kinase
MNILIAIDSFKGSLSSKQANHAVKKAFENTMNVRATSLPLADGGEGTIDALKDVLKGHVELIDAHDSLMRINKHRMLYFSKESVLIELAETAGLSALENNEKNPLFTSTYGVGEQFKSAVDAGAKHVYIGIGGSSTNDGGIGFLNALGVTFMNEDNEPLLPIGASLNHIHSVQNKEELKKYEGVKITLLCDVNNPLTGMNGAAHIYAPQKGASDEDVLLLDEGLKHYADVLFMKDSVSHLPGMGAAGGFPLSLMHFFNAEIKSGFDVLGELTNLEKLVAGADLVITGEGSIDASSLNEKAPYKLAKLAKKHKKSVYAFTGAFNDVKNRPLYPFDEIYPIKSASLTLEEAMKVENAKKSLYNAAKRAASLLKKTP